MPPKPRRTYGSGSVYKRKSDGRYCATIEAGYTKTGGRRRITVTGKTEAEAKTKRKLKLRELDQEHNATDSTVSERTTVKAWSDKWLELTLQTSSPNTYTKDLAAIRQWIVPTIGNRRLDQLTRGDRRAVRKAITDAGRSLTSAHTYDGTLLRMLKAAAEEGHRIPSNVIGMKPPAKAVSDRTAMSVEEALLLLAEAAQQPHGSRWVAAILQGVRQGECLGLTWENTTGGVLKLAWQLQPLPYNKKRDRTSGFRVPDGYEARQLEGQMHLVRPKSKAGWRIAPIITPMQAALDHWRAISPASPHGLVWPAADGSPRNENDDRAEWYAMQDAAGVRHPNGRHYFVHEARHTTATLLRALHVPEEDRVAIMGHSSYASTTAYEHPDPKDLAALRNALEKVAGRLGITAKP